MGLSRLPWTHLVERRFLRAVGTVGFSPSCKIGGICRCEPANPFRPQRVRRCIPANAVRWRRTNRANPRILSARGRPLVHTRRFHPPAVCPSVYARKSRPPARDKSCKPANPVRRMGAYPQILSITARLVDEIGGYAPISAPIRLRSSAKPQVALIILNEDKFIPANLVHSRRRNGRNRRVRTDRARSGAKAGDSANPAAACAKEKAPSPALNCPPVSRT